MLYRNGNDAIVQFKTRSGRTLHNTIEHVKLEPPTEITFLHLEGPLLHAREEFVLEALNGATMLSHRGEFIWRKILLAGWLVGMAYVRPAFERVMKSTCARSRKAAKRVRPAAVCSPPGKTHRHADAGRCMGDQPVAHTEWEKGSSEVPSLLMGKSQACPEPPE